MTEWIQNWKLNGWQTSRRAEVENKEDLEELDRHCRGLDVVWNYVEVKASYTYPERLIHLLLFICRLTLVLLEMKRPTNWRKGEQESYSNSIV